MSRGLDDWIRQLLGEPDLTTMGHEQRNEDGNLGLGWLYYSLVRAMRPSRVIVIGSYRGFVPLVLGRALQDNVEGGRVDFVDPSFVDGFWKDPTAVRAYFDRFGVTNITHHLMTTQQFVETSTYRSLESLGIVFIDGYHTAEQARFDYEAFVPKLADDGVVLLHDSVTVRPSRIYGEGRTFTHTVRLFVDGLKRDRKLQVLDLPWGSGVTMVRRAAREDPVQ